MQPTPQHPGFAPLLRIALLLALLLSPLLLPPPAGAQLTTALTGWRLLSLPAGVTAPFISGMAISPNSTAIAFLATSTGVYSTSDVGLNWSHVAPALAAATDVEIASSDGQRIYAWSSALYRSDDGGATWTQMAMPPSLCGMVVAPNDAERLYARACAGSNGLAVFRSDDGGITWSAPAPSFTQILSSLVVSTTSAERLIGTTGSAAYISADGGATWSSSPIGSGISAATLAVDPVAGTIYLGHSTGLLRSLDDGQSWQSSDAERGFAIVLAWPFAANTAAGGTATSGWKITSAGSNWAIAPVALPPSLRMLARSARDTSGLYALSDTGLWYAPAAAFPAAQTFRLYLPLNSGGMSGLGDAVAQAIARANSYRALAGAPALYAHPALVAASQNHASYHMRNYGDNTAWTYGPHGEVAGKPGFTGQWPGDRDRAAQFPWAAGWEVMHAYGDPLQSVDGWMKTVYHRTGLLDPLLHYAGYGNGRNTWTRVDVIDLGRGPADSGVWSPAMPFVIGYPADGELDVPVWGNSETPSPLPPGASFPIGHPFTLQIGRGTALHVDTAELRDGVGLLVAVHPNPAGCSTTCYALIPVASLHPYTTYTVHVRGNVDGTAFDRAWRFTTGACPSPVPSYC